MHDVMSGRNTVPSMAAEAVSKVRELETLALGYPQKSLHTGHVLHAGIYARTIKILAGDALTGAYIKIATTLIVQGDVLVYIGDETVRVSGYKVIPASAGRKQAFFANEDTMLTMIFKCNAKTIEEAEMMFTDETHLLLSRREEASNHIIITGE